MWGTITKVFSKAFSDVPGLLKGVGAVAGAVAPLVSQGTQRALPRQPRVKTAAQMEQEAGAAATARRREIARRRGFSSTVRTTRLGVQQDVTTRRTAVFGR